MRFAIVVIVVAQTLLQAEEESKTTEGNTTQQRIPNYVELLTQYRKQQTKIKHLYDPKLNNGVCALNYTYNNTTVLFFYWHVWKAGGTTIKMHFEQMVNEKIVDSTICGARSSVYYRHKPEKRETENHLPEHQALIFRWLYYRAGLGTHDNLLLTLADEKEDKNNTNHHVYNSNIFLDVSQNGHRYICYYFSFVRSPVDKFRSAFWEAHSRQHHPDMPVFSDKRQEATDTLNRILEHQKHQQLHVDGHYRGGVDFLTTKNGYSVPLSFLTLLKFQTRFMTEVFLKEWLLPWMKRLGDPRLQSLNISNIVQNITKTRNFSQSGRDHIIPKLSNEDLTDNHIKAICEAYWDDYLWFGHIVTGEREKTLCNWTNLWEKHNQTDFFKNNRSPAHTRYKSHS
eukprot:m.60195 g.60195  ORF g.60195 m.60195 type:complete len:397 (-) comp11302_c0_seq2:99-1289(-)